MIVLLLLAILITLLGWWHEAGIVLLVLAGLVVAYWVLVLALSLLAGTAVTGLAAVSIFIEGIWNGIKFIFSPLTRRFEQWLKGDNYVPPPKEDIEITGDMIKGFIFLIFIISISVYIWLYLNAWI